MVLNNYIVVGAGIAGMNIAEKLQQKTKESVLLFEKNNYIGGRVKSIHTKNSIYESGAGRFNNNHNQLIDLIKRFKMKNKMIKIPKTWVLKPEKKHNVEFNDINKFMEYCIKLGKTKSKKYLNTLSFSEFVTKELGMKYTNYLLDNHPYYSELVKMNCNEALYSFGHDLSENKQFYILAGGLNQITDHLYSSFKQHNGKAYLNHTLESIDYENNIFILSFKTKNKIKKYKCKKLILALDSYALKKFKFLNSIKELDSVHCAPLLRTYQKFPLDKNKEVWFNGMSKVVTPRKENKIRYFIPVDYKNGIVMSSYTDGLYSNYWYKHIKKGDHEETLMKALRTLFPDKKIPNPIWTKNYYWKLGCCYWKPGIDVPKVSKKLLKPLNKELYICGDCYSRRQAWQEGALDTSNMVFDLLETNLKKKTKKKQL